MAGDLEYAQEKFEKASGILSAEYGDARKRLIGAYTTQMMLIDTEQATPPGRRPIPDNWARRIRALQASMEAAEFGTDDGGTAETVYVMFDDEAVQKVYLEVGEIADGLAQAYESEP